MTTVQPRQQVFKHQYKNGFTLLVYPTKNVPKVSMQLWYRVGSKDEKTGEKGLAHFLEHMLFKGTERLSESDINLVTHKLSGYCNAFTSYDYTAYIFDVPSQHWQAVLPLYADCMQHARLDPEHLASELKAVIQELKMYKDDYSNALFEELIAAIFAQHPYHYPIIGFKQDLWNLDRQALERFYRHHYVPNNATLVMVGDVEISEVVEKVRYYFEPISPAVDYKKDRHYWQEDIAATSITLYRSVEQSTLLCSWVIPGLRSGSEYTVQLVEWLLAQGKGSRLYKKIVDELQLATDLSTQVNMFFDYGIFALEFQVAQEHSFEKIQQIVAQEIIQLIENGWTPKELQRAQKKIEVDYLDLFAQNQQLASALGESYLATGDAQYLVNYLDNATQDHTRDIKSFLVRFLRPTVMHTGRIIPISQQEQQRLEELQEKSDELDNQILSARKRQALVEEGRYVRDVQTKQAKSFLYPEAQRATLSNGMAVVYCHNNSIPTIEIILEFKTKYYYEPSELQGLSLLVSMLLLEGTHEMTGYELALELESYGMSLHVEPGSISLSMLKGDLQKGLKFLYTILTQSLLSNEAISKIKQQMLHDLDMYWDEPTEFIHQLAHEQIYKNHPYSKNMLGTVESINRITREDVVAWYKATLVPGGACMAVVGDLQGYDVPTILQQMFSSWHGTEPDAAKFSQLSQPKEATILKKINRDQIVVCFAGLSISRLHEDFDKLLIFDQIFSGGVLNSMSSRLFILREETGLFYTIKGSLLAHADEQPGMIIVKTMVSRDRLQEALLRIKQTIDTTVDTITQEEFEQAQQALINSLVDNFATHQQTAAALLFQHRYKLPRDYFATRATTLMKVTLSDMVHAVKRILGSDKLVCVTVGRI